MNTRIQNLLKAHRNLVHTNYREIKDLTILQDDQTELEPVVIRKAKALALLLDETRVVILKNELIVGLRTIYGSLETGQNVFGSFDFELPVQPATNHCLRYFPHYLTETEREELQSVGLSEGYAIAHIPFGGQRVLTLGYGGLIDTARQHLQDLAEAPDTPKASSKTAFLHAIIIVFEAATRFVLRHALEAERLSHIAPNAQRQEELQQIAASCRWIATQPPRNFSEALQLFWFTCLIHKMEEQACLPIGRFDQDLHSFYLRDYKTGYLTQDTALELLECLWIKFNIESDLTTDTCENITLSGQNMQGHDVTNDLTYLCLKASLELRLPDPKINVRFHRASSSRLWQICCEIVKEGIGGFPNFFNDDANIPSLVKVGIPLVDARLYSCDGCQELIIPGKGDFYPTFSSVDFLDTLLQVLHQPRSYETFRDFMVEYKAQLSQAVKHVVAIANGKDMMMAKFTPVPFLSATLEGCLEQAMDKTAGGTHYNFTGCLGRAFSNTANSLAVIKKLVFDEHLYELTTLTTALTKNWDGYERLRLFAINRVPKYGNDDNYVDALAVEIADHFIQEVPQYQNPRGGQFYPGLFTFHHVTRGGLMPASPDGRRAGDGVASHISPVAGTDLNGPTAVLNSALKICHLQPSEGAALGVRFHPSALQGDIGTQNLIAFTKTFMENGGLSLQFNVVDSKTLRTAQQHPERYQNLIVRVWGFSAYFVTLTKQYQDDVIARTEHGFH
jgi:pyruvate formate-lyase/glycerol dehydratase family glycyl radical enzyme